MKRLTEETFDRAIEMIIEQMADRDEQELEYIANDVIKELGGNDEDIEEAIQYYKSL